jgi:uncharacterized RDD family membrane protein YckC
MSGAQCGCGFKQSVSSAPAAASAYRPRLPAVLFEPKGKTSPAGGTETPTAAEERGNEGLRRQDQPAFFPEPAGALTESKAPNVTPTVTERRGAIQITSPAAPTSRPGATPDKAALRTSSSKARAAQRPVSPLQKPLFLEPLAAPAVETAAPPQTQGLGPPLLREVLFSRLLAGIIDLIFPALLGLLFLFAANRLLDLDIFSPTAMRWWLIFSVAFFFANSIYFLWAIGQTVGMRLTSVRLVDQYGGQVPLRRILLRVLLFLPSAALLLGLFPAIFDPWCRCLHDRLSRTAVLPVDEEQEQSGDTADG